MTYLFKTDYLEAAKGTRLFLQDGMYFFKTITEQERWLSIEDVEKGEHFMKEEKAALKKMAGVVILTESQREKLEKIWFVYGNEGKKHSHCNHRYIQNILEHGEDTEAFYKRSAKNDLTQDCIDAVKAILNVNE